MNFNPLELHSKRSFRSFKYLFNTFQMQISCSNQILDWIKVFCDLINKSVSWIWIGNWRAGSWRAGSWRAGNMWVVLTSTKSSLLWIEFNLKFNFNFYKNFWNSFVSLFYCENWTSNWFSILMLILWKY